MFLRQTFRSAARSPRASRLGQPVPIPQSQTPEEFADFQPGIGPGPTAPSPAPGAGFPTSAPPAQPPVAPQPPVSAPGQQVPLAPQGPAPVAPPVAPSPAPAAPAPAPAAAPAQTPDQLRLQSLIVAWEALCKAQQWPALLDVQRDLINQYGFTITDFNYDACTVTVSPEPV